MSVNSIHPSILFVQQTEIQLNAKHARYISFVTGMAYFTKLGYIYSHVFIVVKLITQAISPNQHEVQNLSPP